MVPVAISSLARPGDITLKEGRVLHPLPTLPERHLVSSPLVVLILSASWALISPCLPLPRMAICGACPVGAGALSPQPPCVVRVPTRSAHNASALPGAGLADHRLYVVELGEP